MFRGITDLLQGLALFLPVEVLAPLVAIAAIAAVPIWFETVRDKQIRGTIRRMVRAEPPERQALARRALALAANKPRRLATVVRQAMQYDQRSLRDDALVALDATGNAKREVEHLRSMIRPKETKFRDPLEAAVHIEHLIDQGLRVAALEQIAAARATFPSDPDLRALEHKLHAE